MTLGISLGGTSYEGAMMPAPNSPGGREVIGRLFTGEGHSIAIIADNGCHLSASCLDCNRPKCVYDAGPAPTGVELRAWRVKYGFCPKCGVKYQGKLGEAECEKCAGKGRRRGGRKGRTPGQKWARPCTTCNQPAGEVCISTAGLRLSTAHNARLGKQDGRANRGGSA